MGNHRLGKNAKEAELNEKEGTTRGSFQWEITGLQFVAYLNGRLYLREAGLCRRSQTQWERNGNQDRSEEHTSELQSPC